MEFYAHGKLLLTGEYLVMTGALALAVPLNKGQKMKVKENNNKLKWIARFLDQNWFKVEFDNQLNILKCNNDQKAKKLQQILIACTKISDNAIEKLRNKKITTTLEFHPNWGWGSSSTLIHLLSQYLKINPYHLLEKTFGGSGYDLACANTQQPIFFQRLNEEAIIQTVKFSPPFIDNLAVLWLNKKQSSQREIKRVFKENIDHNEAVNRINEITKAFVNTDNIESFMELIKEHEQIIAKIIKATPVHEKLFPDFKGAIKSLGAWGGDFVLFASHNDFNYSALWFKKKGYPISFKLSDIIIELL